MATGLLSSLSCTRLLDASKAPGNHGRLDRAAGFVIEPMTVGKATGERQLICAALIFAKHFDDLVRRRFAVAIELRQSLFARCHLIILHFRCVETFEFPKAPCTLQSVKDNAGMRSQCGITDDVAAV